MLYIREIMKLFKCDEAIARQIYDVMAASGFDFSEATKAEFKREAIIARTIQKEAVR